MAAPAETIAASSPEYLGDIEHPGIINADFLANRAEIEQQARLLIQGRELSPKPEVSTKEYQDNGRTAIMEALTASGHLSEVIISGTIEEIEDQMMGRLLNGWDDNLPVHEKDRRFAEICNLLYGQRVRAAIVVGELPENTAILEISDHPEPLIGAQLGYRDSNKKGMVRSSHLVGKGEGQYDLVIGQVSRGHANGYSTMRFFEACGVDVGSSDKPSDLAALETPLIYNTQDYADAVVDMMRLLDRHQGDAVLYGDTGRDKLKHVPYAWLRQESFRRENEIRHFTDDLAKLEKQLDDYLKDGRISRRDHFETFQSEVERILAAICTLEPDYAEATFGKRAAPDFYDARELVAMGRTAEAQQLLSDKSYLRETITFCGVSISTGKAKELGLEVNSYGELVGKGKENWTWKSGTCAVKSCPTRPGKTKVGPCSVCRKCQAKFDKGEDPTKRSAPKIERKRGEPLSIDKDKHRKRLGRTALKAKPSQPKRRRGDH